jgi:hypothetical protein
VDSDCCPESARRQEPAGACALKPLRRRSRSGEKTGLAETQNQSRSAAMQCAGRARPIAGGGDVWARAAGAARGVRGDWECGQCRVRLWLLRHTERRPRGTWDRAARASAGSKARLCSSIDTAAPFQAYAPAMVMPSMRSVGEASDPRKTRSLPIAVTFLSISTRLPATVTSSTACVNWPF